MKVRNWFFGTIAFLIASVLFLMASGTKEISVFSIISHFSPFDSSDLELADQIILSKVRLPRILLALVVGAALAVSGTCQQAIFRNPLADPFILGLSSGAALGAALAICLNHSEYVSLAAFIGGIGAIFLVEKLSGRYGKNDRSITQLLLVGMAISAFSSALLSTIMSVYSQQMQAIFFWVMGSVAQPPDNFFFLSILIFAGIIILFSYHREMDIITLGEEQAFFLGIPIKQLRKMLLLLSAFIVSIAVSMSGPIGFIGLITPHLLRNWFTPTHRYLLPLAALWGGILLLWSDGLIRLFPLFSSLPIGAVTALFGSPFFLYILIQRGKRI